MATKEAAIMDYLTQMDKEDNSLILNEGGKKIDLFKPKLDESTLDMEWKQEEADYLLERYQGSPKDIAGRMANDETFKNLMYKYHGAKFSDDPENPLDFEERTKFPTAPGYDQNQLGR